MSYKFGRIIITGLAAAALSGCATPQHTNLLVFGTNTQFGIKVGADATQVPAIQVGYNRQELVLMPLLANTEAKGTSSNIQLKPCPAERAPAQAGPRPTPAELSQNCKFIGTDGNLQDAYSVLASFGTNYDIGSGADAKVGGGIAQYFATGLAARELATHGSSLVAATASATVEAGGRGVLSGQISYASQVAKNLAISAAVTDQNLSAQLGNLDTAISSGTRFADACNGLITKQACASEIEKFQQPGLVTMPARLWPLAAAYKFQ